jgi:hypothetical protein
MRATWFLSAAVLVQTIAFDRPESWAMKYFASESLMTGLGAPRDMPFPSVRVGLEGEWLPYLTEAQRTVGFEGYKTEDFNRVPVAGRLRLSIALPEKLSVTFGYLPPIWVNGVRAHLFSTAVERPFSPTRDLTLGLGITANIGKVIGSFTCPDLGGPFQCEEKSSDAFTTTAFSGTLSGAYRIAVAHGLEPYASASVNVMDLMFAVDARYAGIVDQTALRTRGVTFSTTLGLLLPVVRGLDVAGEVFYSPLDVKRPQEPARTIEGLFNVRGLVAYRFP